MPLTVTAWPDGADPRDPSFSLFGYAFGQVPPERFELLTTGALAPYDDLNTGRIIVGTVATEILTAYVSDDGVYGMEKEGHLEEVAAVPPWTVKLNLSGHVPGELVYTGTIRLLYPTAIRQYSIVLIPQGPGPSKIPNPVTVNPRNYLVDP